MATIKSGFTSFGRNRSGWSRLSSSRRLRRSSFSSSVSFGRPFPFHFGFKIGFPSSSRLGGSGSGSTHKPCFFSMYSDIGPFFGGRPRLGIVSRSRIQSRDLSIQRAEMCLCIDDMNRDLNVFRRVVGCTPHSSALITRHQQHQHRRRRKRPDANTRKRTRTKKKRARIKSKECSPRREEFLFGDFKSVDKNNSKKKGHKGRRRKNEDLPKKD